MSRKIVRKRKVPLVASKSLPSSHRNALNWRSLMHFWPVLPLVVLITVCFFWRYSDAYTNHYQLRSLEVDGLFLLTGEEVLEFSGLELGNNILSINMSLVARQIESHPWIKSATILRKPPDRLVVQLTERRRLAWVDIGEKYGIDEDGILLPNTILPRESSLIRQLPLIKTGVSAVDSIDIGEALTNVLPTLQKILDWWIIARSEDPDFCAGIVELEALTDDAIVLRLAGEGLEVRLPFSEAGQRLKYLKRLMPKIYREYPDPVYVDLRFEGQLIVGGKEVEASG